MRQVETRQVESRQVVGSCRRVSDVGDSPTGGETLHEKQGHAAWRWQTRGEEGHGGGEVVEVVERRRGGQSQVDGLMAAVRPASSQPRVGSSD
jgi:hypothetical protein